MGEIKIMPEFLDAQEQHISHPDTFDAPTQDELNRLQIGDFIKVCIHPERFWAQVTKIFGDRVVAIVDNNLVFVKEVRFGELIEVEKRHIYDIMRS